MLRIFGVPIALLCLYWHLIATVIIVVNYDVYIRHQDVVVDLKKAYLAFSIIGILCFALIAAPLFVYEYKYAATAEWGQSRLTTGIAIMFLLSSLPIFVIELILFLGNNGLTITYPLDGIVFISSIIATIFGWVISWFAYMRCTARRLHKRLCYERQIIDDDNNASYDGENAMRISVFPNAAKYSHLQI